MAHFNMTIHTANGTFANGGIRHNLGEIPVQSGKQSEHFIPAKLRRLSRPNTIEEIRLKRRNRKKKERERNRTMSKRARRLERKRKTQDRDIKQENNIKKLVTRVNKERKRAVDFWRLWDKEKMLRSTGNINVHQIERNSLEDFDDGNYDIVGEGTFGVCKKKVYRGHIVAVKYYKDNSLPSDVEKEALMISTFDHPGLPFLFGANVKNKPYLLVTEFYGIDGQCVTLENAVKGRLPLSIPNWANVLGKTSEALSYIHSQGFIHGDIKSNNIVIRKESDSYSPVIIDFGKMKKISEAKKYNLNSKEKERYSNKYRHIAPEVIEGSHPKSPASDIYSLGMVISLVCYYHRSSQLQNIAKQCIHGTPEKRPNIMQIISHIQCI